MSIKIPQDFKEFSQKYNLDSQNFLTESSAKIIKNLTYSEVPTSVLYMYNDYQACPYANTCRDVCLIQSGRAIFSKAIMDCRIRRHKAFIYDRPIFMRYCVSQVIRHYAKNRAYSKTSFRFNGTSDWHILRMPITITKSDSEYILKAYKVYIEPVKYTNIIECLKNALDTKLNQSVGQKLYMYDYTKRPITDTDLKLAKKLNYHLTLSHGSKVDLLSIALKLKLNYACSFLLGKDEELPKTFEYQGKVFEVLDGDKTDFRVLDKSDKTYILGLKYKRTKNQDIDKVKKFCINTSI